MGHEGFRARWLDVLLERDVEGAHALVSRILCEWNHLALDSEVRSALFDDAAQSLFQEGGGRKNVATKPRNDESLNPHAQSLSSIVPTTATSLFESCLLDADEQ